MNEDTGELNNIEAAVVAGKQAAGISPRLHTLGSGDVTIPLFLVEHDQNLKVPTEALAEFDARLPEPRRRKGTARHTELDSFIEHVNRFKGGPTTVWADIHGVQLTAIYDYHPQAGAAWCEHRAIYTCPLTDQWREWNAISGNLMSVAEFGEFIEAHRDELTSGTDKDGNAYPAPAAVEEMAMNLHIQTKGTYTRKVNKRTGDFELTCKQETDEKVSTEVPRAFLLALPVFEGGDAFEVEARVRLVLREGNAKLGVVLHRADEVLRVAFGEVRKAVADKCEVPVFAGSPES
ncbi:MAG: DUF2303 family protein [Polyangiaceae bacterium]